MMMQCGQLHFKNKPIGAATNYDDLLNLFIFLPLIQHEEIPNTKAIYLQCKQFIPLMCYSRAHKPCLQNEMITLINSP